jgi:hypothetical protein
MVFCKAIRRLQGNLQLRKAIPGGALCVLLLAVPLPSGRWLTVVVLHGAVELVAHIEQGGTHANRQQND